MLKKLSLKFVIKVISTSKMYLLNHNLHILLNIICYFSVDGTFSNQLGRFVNDSVHGNAVMKRITIKEKNCLCLFAIKEIPFGEELRYDYGDTGLWWRKKVKYYLQGMFVVA